MQELELTWSQVMRIWWAAFWRGVLLANFTLGLYVLVVGLTLMIVAHRNWTESDWVYLGALLAWASAFIPATRLALKARYRGFRVVIVGRE